MQFLVLPLPELLRGVTCLVFHFYNSFLSHFFVAPSLRAWIWLMMRWDTGVLLWWIVWPSCGNVLSLLQSHISCGVVWQTPLLAQNTQMSLAPLSLSWVALSLLLTVFKATANCTFCGMLEAGGGSVSKQIYQTRHQQCWAHTGNRRRNL